MVFDLAGEFGWRSSAVEHGKLESRISEWIMACGDVDASDGFFLTDTEGDDRSGGISLSEHRFEAGLFKNLCRGQGEFPTEKSCVMTDDDERSFAVDWRFFTAQLCLKSKRETLGGQAEVFEGEVVGD